MTSTTFSKHWRQNLIQEASKEFNSFHNTPHLYKAQVNQVSDLLGLKGVERLVTNELPAIWAGDIFSSSEKIATIGINPKHDSEKLGFENAYKKDSKNGFLDFKNNLFKYYKEKSLFNIPYYRYLANCFTNSRFKQRAYFDYCHNHIINFDVIPYYSNHFNFKQISIEAENYIMERFENHLLPIIIDAPTISKAVLHDKRLAMLLLKSGFLSERYIIYRKPIIGRESEKVFKRSYKGVDFYIFSRFIPNGGFSKLEVFDKIWK